MTQLSQGLGFNLADALAGDRKVLSHLFQRVIAPVVQAEAHLDDLFLSGSQRLQDVFGHLLQVDVDYGFRGGDDLTVFDEIAQVGILLFPDGSFQ